MKNKIKVLLAEYEMTQEELANKIGVSRQALSRVINGRTAPSADTMLKISEFFNKDAREIFIQKQ